MFKTKYDTDGWRSDCFYYDPCPICYGCRNSYQYCHSRCDNICGHNKKKNICLSKLHYPKNFEIMIKRPVIDLDKERGN